MNPVPDHYLAEAWPAGRVHPTVAGWRLKSQLRRLILRDGLACCWCKRTCNPDVSKSADAFPTREHLVRKADGGSSQMYNQRIACRKCNNTRHAPGWLPPGQPVPFYSGVKQVKNSVDAAACRV